MQINIHFAPNTEGRWVAELPEFTGVHKISREIAGGLWSSGAIGAFPQLAPRFLSRAC